MRKLNAQINVSGGGGGGGGRGGGRGGGGGGLSSATASISAPAENFLAALQARGRDPQGAGVSAGRVRSDQDAARESARADADRAEPAGRRASEPASQPVREERRAVLADPRGTDSRAAESHARRRAQVPRSVLRRQLRRVRGGRAGRTRPTCRRPRRRCSASWNTTKAYKPLVAPFKKVAPINEKIETPDKANARVPGRRAVPAVAERSRLSGDRPGQLHVRRADHVAHLRPHPQSRRPELRRERAVDRAGGRRFGDAVGHRQPEPRRRARRSSPASWTS